MKIGHVKRKPELSLKAQLAELRAQYTEFQYLFCTGNYCGGATITFTYAEEVEENECV